MSILSKILIGLVATEHIFFLWFEMFSWEKTGKKLFKKALPEELFVPTKTLAANQGLYNGFLAAGLVWVFFISDPVWKSNIAVFFLCAVMVAGILGALTASKKIFYVQALPAILALSLLLMGNL